MRRTHPGVAGATPRLFATGCSAIFLAAFLTIISASAAVPQTATEGLNPAEQWVSDQVTADKVADLDAALNADHTKEFPKEEDRRLRARFLENLLTGTLLDVKRRHGVEIIGAIINERIDLSNAHIACEVGLEDCQFNKSVTFERASFARDVSFGGSTFKEVAVFDRMTVGGDAGFTKAVFKRRSSFNGADITGAFLASYAHFTATAEFFGLKVGQLAYLEMAVFEEGVIFMFADIGKDFIMASTKSLNKKKLATFRSMKVGGDASFYHASFEGPVDLRYADFGLLDLSGASWPNDSSQFHVEGMSYKTILADQNESKSHKVLVELADQANYSANVYSRLEEFFLRQGYRADADEAFIAGKIRERKEYFLSGDWFGWLRSWMLDLLVGYGRRPWQAGVPCGVLVALGCVLFSPKKMEPQNPEDTPRVYNRFWYSLGLFLPFVDLQSNKVWKPKADQTFLRNYMRVHILLGWILVPLVLAAVTGLIK